MSDAPLIDDRDQEELFEALLERADAYTDAWDPHTPDTGRTVVRIFSTFEADVRKRLNEVPEKHQLAFLDALDFARRPPQAASVPLTFKVSTDLDRNVPIPGGTTAIAETSDGDSQPFELPQDGGFEATGAQLTDVIAVEPTADVIVDHSDVCSGPGSESESESASGGERTELFVGDDIQDHVLYMGSDDSLTLEAGSPLSISVETSGDADRFFEATVWEYYGEDADGNEGWHRLEEPSPREGTDDDIGVEALQERLQSRSRTQSADDRDQPSLERTFTAPGKTIEHAVNGVESRWLRCSLRDEVSVFSTTISSLSIHVGSAGSDGGLPPDLMLSNDVPLSPDDGEVRPFGRMPHPPSTFYVACREAFTKPGGVVELEFVPPGADEGEGENESDDEGRQNGENENGETAATDAVVNATSAGVGVLGGPPRISWEYWNGDGWTRLESVDDETSAFRTAGTVRFDVPHDIEATTVSGHENVWIRARLVSGNYGQPSFAVTDDGGRGGLVDEPDSPQFRDVTVQYDHGGRSFETVFRYNTAAYSDNLVERAEPFDPFLELPEEKQTLYLGFDDTLKDGPLSLFVLVEDATYPQWFDPGVQWEYCVDPDGFEWSKLDVQDQTGGLTERGIVALTFPEPTTAFELFDRERHWIRVRVTEDEFDRTRRRDRNRDQDRGKGTSGSGSGSGSGSNHGNVGDATTTTSDTLPADVSSERTTTPPVLEGMYPNTQWAYNTTTIEGEILGSSDGSHEQSFRCAHAPVIDVDVWVDELSTLPSGERRRLASQRPQAVEAEYDSRGELAAFWVRWASVRDFLDSDPTDRHYVVNRTLGEITFGDGDHGAIPPAGQDNVKVTYTTGGGSDGNVAANTITDLKSSIALVESVSNPTPADGGADIESTDALVSRSTNRIKHRAKAVTARDYEQVAKAEFPELAHVTCDPGLDGANGSRVTVLIVPQTERDKPVPSMELKHRVRDELYEHAPASIVSADDADIVVRGPGYGELSVETTIRATDVESVSLLKQTVERRLDEYLHPLTGNRGTGWDFGELPAVEPLADVVSGVESVSDVLEFDVTIERNGERRSLSGYGGQSSLPRDTLVCSGSHEITVTMGGDQ